MISPIQKLQTKIKMTPTMTMIPPILQTWGTRKRARLPASVTRPDFKRLTKVALGGADHLFASLVRRAGHGVEKILGS